MLVGRDLPGIRGMSHDPRWRDIYRAAISSGLVSVAMSTPHRGSTKLHRVSLTKNSLDQRSGHLANLFDVHGHCIFSRAHDEIRLLVEILACYPSSYFLWQE